MVAEILASSWLHLARCGLAAEVTWALDILNILLFDDQTVVYFGLHHMPGKGKDVMIYGLDGNDTSLVNKTCYYTWF